MLSWFWGVLRGVRGGGGFAELRAPRVALKPNERRDRIGTVWTVWKAHLLEGPKNDCADNRKIGSLVAIVAEVLLAC